MIDVDAELNRLRKNAWEHPLTRATGAGENPELHFGRVSDQASLGLTINK